MESLGGDNAWIDRFLAQHSALAYYWGVCILYALSPRYAYQFSELVEGHATDTYEGAPCCGLQTSKPRALRACRQNAVCGLCALQVSSFLHAASVASVCASSLF